MRSLASTGRTRRPFFTDDEFETIAIDELSRVGLLPITPGPIRIEWYIEKRFNITPTYADLPDPLLGVTIFGDDGVVEILIARALDEEGTQVSQRRVRTTLSHEASHGVLHAHLFATAFQERPLFGDFTDPDRPRLSCKVDAAKIGAATAYTGDWQEFQANRLMSCLLLPRALVMKALAPYATPAGTLGQTRPDRTRFDEASRALADIFDVNPQVVRHRLDHLYPKAEEHQQHL